MGNPDFQWKNHRRVRDFHCHVRFSDRVCPGRVEVGETHKVLFFSMDVTERPFTTCLVGGLEHFLFFHSVGNFIIPTDFHSIIFQRGRSTTNQLSAISHPFPLPKAIPETNQQDVQPHPLLTFSD